MMCLVRYRIGDSPEKLKLYTDNWDIIGDQFSPCYEIVDSLDLTLTGTYSEQKERAKDIVARIRKIDDGSLTYDEYMIIAKRLQRIARKTGTLKLFRKAGLLS